jgi:AcrR family transcriptional regulator
MSRPSQKTDEQLIKAAQEMLKSTGLSRMNLRDVAAKAGVNLGMFHYHFKTKDQFIRVVLQDTYEKFFKDFNLRIEGQDKPLEKLRQALLTVGQFARDNRQLVLSIMRDVLDHNQETLSFVKNNGKRHAKIIWDLVGQCQKDGSLKKMPRPQIMAFLMPVVAAPALAIGGVENVASSLLTKGFLKGVGIMILSDPSIRQRVDMALRAVGTGEGGKG